MGEGKSSLLGGCFGCAKATGRFTSKIAPAAAVIPVGVRWAGLIDSKRRLIIKEPDSITKELLDSVGSVFDVLELYVFPASESTTRQPSSSVDETDVNGESAVVAFKGEFPNFSHCHLRRITVRRTKVSLLPFWFGGLKDLETLEVSKCQLATIDPLFFDSRFNYWANIRHIDLSHNQLSSFAVGSSFNSAIKDTLEVLNLSFNLFVDFPEGILQFKNMRKLNLSGNKLSSIPESIKSVKKLAFLYASFNRLTELPGSLESLRHLERLRVAGNHITYISESLKARLGAGLTADGNPLTQCVEVRPSALNVDTSAARLSVGAARLSIGAAQNSGAEGSSPSRSPSLKSSPSISRLRSSMLKPGAKSMILPGNTSFERSKQDTFLSESEDMISKMDLKSSLSSYSRAVDLATYELGVILAARSSQKYVVAAALGVSEGIAYGAPIFQKLESSGRFH